MNKIDLVLFDIGNVLIGFDHHAIAAKLSLMAGQAGPGEFYDTVFGKGLVLALDKGMLSARSFYRELAGKTGLQCDYFTFRQAWCESFHEKKGMAHIVGNVKRQCRIAILSDTNVIHFAFMIRNFSILGLFKRFFLSYRLKSVKAEKKIYHSVLQRLSMEPGQILYIDDKPELADIAKNIGYHTMVFKDIKDLKEGLSQYGIDTDG